MVVCWLGWRCRVSKAIPGDLVNCLKREMFDVDLLNGEKLDCGIERAEAREV